MHLSDTLVFGPLPLSGRSLRLPVGAALLALLVVLLCAAAAGSLLLRPLPAPLAGLLVRVPISFPGRPADRAPTAPDIHVRVMSVPARATVILDGRAIGATPMSAVMPSGHQLVLHREGASDVSLLDPRSSVAIPVWPIPVVLTVRAPMPGGAVTDVQVLRDGRLSLAVASAAAPAERQAWLLDPASAHMERVGPATHDEVPPAGVVVAPDGDHSIALVRGASGTPSTPATTDVLLLNGPEGRRSLLPEGVLARDERVRDLSWAPDSRSALLVSQRPMAGTTSFRVRHLALDGGPRNLVDLPVAPLEGSWTWAPDGHAVAFLVRTTPPVLATLDLADEAVRSAADLSAELLPGAGAAAPAIWTADGALVFAAPRSEDSVSSLLTPSPLASASRPLSSAARLQVLAHGRTDARPLGEATILATAPALGPDGTMLALGRAADSGLLLRTLDPTGHLVAEQPLGVSVTGPVTVRWDLPHDQLVLLQASPRGGIDARVLRISGAAAGQAGLP